MIRKPNKKLIGIFIFIGILMFFTILFYFIGTKIFINKENIMVMFFKESTQGLKVGSPVVFKGVEIGKVIEINLINKESKTLDFDIPVYIAITNEANNVKNKKRLLEELIEKGLRARLSTYSYITGQLMIEFIILPNTEPVFLNKIKNVPEIPGLSVLSFLKHSMAAHKHFETGKDLSMGEFLANLEAARESLGIPKEWLNRSINVGFSGGERKRLMLLRLVMTKPKLAILDEPDSGADATVQKQIVDVIREMPDTTFLFISHQENFTKQITPTDITTLSAGKVMIK